MSVLITGGAGYIGSHIALSLLDCGRPVVVVDNLVSGRRDLVPHGAAFEQVDVGNEHEMARILKKYSVSAVIHCAGSTVVPESVSDPIKYYSNNTVASLGLLRAMVVTGVKQLIFSSTAAVYDVQGDEMVDEAQAIDPLSPYGRSKLMTEGMIADIAAAHELSYFILRYFNVAGADPAGRSGQSTPNATHLIKVAAQVALGLQPELKIFGSDWPTVDGTGVRDFIHVSDLAEAHRLALEYMEGGGSSQCLNCGYGKGYSVREVIDVMKAEAGRDIPIVEEPRRAGDLASVVADSTQLRTLLRWQPKWADLSKIVRHAYAWECSEAARSGSKVGA